jgi:hypothetical protein
MADLLVSAEYLRIRKEHPWLPSKQAMLWARGNVKPLELEWKTFEDNHFAVGRGERDGFDIAVYVDYDDYGFRNTGTPTHDYTGIRNPEFDPELGRDSYARAFDSNRAKRWLALESDTTLPGLAGEYRKRGEARAVAWYDAEQSLKEEAQAYLSDDYVQLVFRAVASVGGVELGEASLGSDLIIDYRTLEKELDNIVAETGVIEEAIEEARANVQPLRDKLEALTL